MAKFNFTLVKGTDVNANLEVEATPAEVAQMLTTGRENLKDIINLLNEAKSTAKELYTEFKPMFQRRAAAALDRDNASWVREEEMNRIKHELEMEKLRQELAELRARASEKAHDAEVERIKDKVLAEAEVVARIPNDGDFSRRVAVPVGSEALNGVRVVRVGGDEIHARRIAETTATTRDTE